MRFIRFLCVVLFYIYNYTLSLSLALTRQISEMEIAPSVVACPPPQLEDDKGVAELQSGVDSTHPLTTDQETTILEELVNVCTQSANLDREIVSVLDSELVANSTRPSELIGTVDASEVR